jgi:CheY-like chemotaxis protein
MVKALVIDDEAPLTMIVGRFLERAGFKVETASSGADGLRKAVAESPDVIIVDVMMPEMDGYEVCRRLRADPRTARATILVLTARGQFIDKQMALQAGADAHAAKPFNGKALVGQIEELLAGKPYFETSLGCQILVLRLQDGIGATTLTTNLACCLASEKGYLAAVADIVLKGGKVGERLGLPATASWPEAAAKDADTLVARLVRHGSGLFALPAPPMKHPSELDPAALMHVLQRLRSWHDFVILDTPRDLGALAPVLLKTSWLVLLLLVPDPVVLRTAQASLTALKQVGSKGMQIWPVLNMAHADGKAVRQQVEKVLDLPVAAMLPWSPQECERAIRDCKPVVLSDPESPLTKSFQSLARQVIKVMDTRAQRRMSG